MYLHEWLICMVNVGKYTIHGSYGNVKFRRFSASVLTLLKTLSLFTHQVMLGLGSHELYPRIPTCFFFERNYYFHQQPMVCWSSPGRLHSILGVQLFCSVSI